MRGHPYDKVPRRPVTCVWEITRRCNLRCVHCENLGGPQSPGELSFDEMLSVADSLQRLGCQLVDITGGEPLLHPDWDRLARALAERGMRTALVTNGTLFDESALDRALAAGVEIAAFSIDGPRAVHDRIRRPSGLRLGRPSSFDKTIVNLRRAASRMGTRVITAVSLLNLPHLGEVRGMLRDLGVTTWQLQLVIPTGRVLEHEGPLVLSPAHLDGLTAFIESAQLDGEMPRIDTSDTIGYYTDRERALRKRTTGQGIWIGCQAGIRSVAITYDGRVRGCSVLPPEFDAGNLHEESLEAIWRDRNRFGYSTTFDADKLEGECKECAYGGLCRAGCTSMAYYSTGTIYSNPFCIARPSLGLRQDACPADHRRVLP